MENRNETARVYVACLGCYNEGRHTGEWLDADQLEYRYETAEGMKPVINRACTILHHDEWAIHDYDGIPLTAEQPDIPHLIAIMRGVEEYGRPFFHWVNLDPSNKKHHDDLSEAFQEAYCGEWDSPKHFAENLAEELGYLNMQYERSGGFARHTVPNPLVQYVDFEWWWNADLRHSHDAVFDHHTGVTHIFRGDA